MKGLEIFKQQSQTPKKNDFVNIEEIISFPDFDEDKDVNLYLKEAGKEILIIGLKSELSVGRKLTEVFEKLGHNKTGAYQKFLNFLGINMRTAFRQRLRYHYYNDFKEKGLNSAKEFMALLPVRYLERFNSLNGNQESKEYFYERFKTISSLKEMKEVIDEEYLECKLQNGKEQEIIGNFSISKKIKEISKESKKIDTLPENKQKEVEEYLTKIQLILEEYIEEEKNKDVEVEAEVID